MITNSHMISVSVESAYITYALSTGTEINDRRWPWTAVTHTIALCTWLKEPSKFDWK